MTSSWLFTPLSSLADYFSYTVVIETFEFLFCQISRASLQSFHVPAGSCRSAPRGTRTPGWESLLQKHKLKTFSQSTVSWTRSSEFNSPCLDKQHITPKTKKIIKKVKRACSVPWGLFLSCTVLNFLSPVKQSSPIERTPMMPAYPASLHCLALWK